MGHPNNWPVTRVLFNTESQPYDRNSLVCINNENFLRGATEQNTRLRQEVIFARASEAMRAR